MANSCEFKTTEASTKSWLRTRNIIDKYLNILDLNKFRTTVTDLSAQANARFGVKERLFSETPDGKKAIPNKNAFKSIDNAKGIYYQKPEGVKQSIADEPTLAKVKQVIEKMGISLMTLEEYAKVSDIDTKGVNGLADLFRNVIAIAEGREHEALTEEMVHITTAALEQINPSLVTELISKVDRFKIYKQVLAQYRDDPRYQLENGKPNIRKIKKEAADKLIAEIITNNGMDTEQYPELMQEENRSLFRRLWDAILDFLRGEYRKSDISMFEKTADIAMSGVDVSQVKGEGIYLQKTLQTVDDVYNTLKAENDKTKLIPATSTDKRHRLYDGQRVAASVTEKIKGDVDWIVSEFDQNIYDQKRDWGIVGHEFAETYLGTALIDENGYARKEPLAVNITTTLPEKVQKALKDYLKDLVNSYKPGTRFLIESQLVNTKVKGMLGSTLDFIAIEPNDQTGVKIDVLDWKFTDINKELSDDVPWFKQEEWKKQMGEYSKMLYNLGYKANQLRRMRMIPFVVKYNPEVKGDWSTPLKINSIEIGKVDSLTEKKLYLMPVALDTESTGNKKIDALVESLQQQYNKLYKTSVTLKDKTKKNAQLNELSKAIRKLKMTLSFEPMVSVMSTFLNDGAKVFKDFEQIDYDKLTPQQIQDKLRQLIEFKTSSSKFIGIDKTFLSMFTEQPSDAETKALLSSLEKRSASIERMIAKFNVLQEDYVVHLALKSGLTAEDVLSQEVPITSFIEKNFLEGTKLSSNTIRLAQKFIMKSKSLAKIRANELTNQYFEKLRALEAEAEKLGKDAFSMIGKVEDGKMSLVKKISKKFYEELSKAKADKDTDFFLENIDYESYKKMADDIVETGKKELEGVIFSSDPEINELEKQSQINVLKNTYDIKSKNFNGFNKYGFISLFKQNLKEDKFLSDDYKELKKTPAAFAVWDFFTNTLNRRAIDAGYLKNRGLSFFPLIEASFIQKIGATGDVVGQAREFFKDLYTINPNEEQEYAKFDPELKAVRKEIPKLFTRTNKAVEALSKDLTKVGAYWIEALMNYEENKLIENTLLTMPEFEKAKGQILIDPTTGDIVYKGGDPVIDEDNSAAAQILEIIIDDALYGIREDEKSLGNVGLSGVTDKLVKDDEKKNAKKVSIKKGFDNLNVLTQGLAVGLKALVAIPNYFGVNFQAYINSGNFYTFSEYLSLQSKLIGDTVGMPTLSTIEKALIDMFIPLNDGLAAEKQRERAIREGKYSQWVSQWSFNDVMMSTMSFPERKLQLTNALAMLQNTMLVDGKLVNIRQYVYAQDRQSKYKVSFENRKQIESTTEERIQKLKKEKSLVNVAKIVNGDVVVEGLTQDQIAEYRLLITEYARDLSGQMNNDNKAGYRRDTIMKSFMMFKGWIPKQVSLRTLDISKDVVTDEWRYGRARLFTKVVLDLGLHSISMISNIINGTDKGIAYMNDLLEAKKEAYKKKYGRELNITEEEFYDMVRRELSNQSKELGLLAGLLALMFTAKAAKPDDDDDAYAKNRYKFWAKALNKIVDELRFYYDPTSIESITSGNIIPQVGLLSKVKKAFTAIANESYGEISGDQELIDDTHVIKAVLDPIPIASQFQRELLPLIDPELAKELGIRVTEQARMTR